MDRGGQDVLSKVGSKDKALWQEGGRCSQWSLRIHCEWNREASNHQLQKVSVVNKLSAHDKYTLSKPRLKEGADKVVHMDT